MGFKIPRFSRLRNRATVRSPNGDVNAAEEPYADEAMQAAQKKPGRRKAFIAAVAAVVVLVLGAIPVTYSYLTASSETVVNTFAGGAISLTLDEAKVDTDGNPQGDEPRVQENTYKVIPGATLYKDPTVTVLEGSEVCYVYLYVDNPLDEDYFTLDYSSDWIKVATTGTKTLYVYKTTVDASDGDVVLSPIFTQVTVSSELTAEQIEAMGEVQIKVQAYAIQAEGVDLSTSIQMAAAYFEAEFDFEWTDVDTTVEIDGLTTEGTDDSGETEDSKEADTSSDTADGASSSDETDSSDTAATDAASGDTDSSAAESGSSSSSEASSSGDSGSDSSDSSGSDTGSDIGTDAADSSDDAAALDIIE